MVQLMNADSDNDESATKLTSPVVMKLLARIKCGCDLLIDFLVHQLFYLSFLTFSIFILTHSHRAWIEPI